MKRIAIRETGAHRTDQPLDDMFYAQAYYDLADALGDHAQLIVVKDTYEGDRRFARGWLFRGNGRHEHLDTAIDVDLIYNMDPHFTPDPDVPMVNGKDFDLLVNDKWNIARLFPDISPATRLAKNAEELEAALKQIPTEKVVVKPLDGSSGRGVAIGTREEVKPKVESYPVLVQQWIDTSAGIPDLIDAPHDLRLIVMNGMIAFSFTRTPKKGSLISNFALGGMMMPVVREDRPTEAIDLLRRVDDALEHFGPRIYSMDCARDRSGRWYLIEINSPPAPQNCHECGDEGNTYMGMHADLLLGACD